MINTFFIGPAVINGLFAAMSPALLFLRAGLGHGGYSRRGRSGTVLIVIIGGAILCFAIPGSPFQNINRFFGFMAEQHAQQTGVGDAFVIDGLLQKGDRIGQSLDDLIISLLETPFLHPLQQRRYLFVVQFDPFGRVHKVLSFS